MTIDPQLVLLATTIAGFLWTAWRENRNRKWGQEDRKAETKQILEQAAAEAEATRIKTATIAETLKMEALLEAARLRVEMVATAARLRLEAEAVAATVRDDQHRQSELLSQKIDATKEAAHEAYKEANGINAKIEDLNKRLISQQQASSTALKEAQTIGEATLQGVTDGTNVTREVKVTADAINAKLPEPVP